VSRLSKTRNNLRRKAIIDAHRADLAAAIAASKKPDRHPERFLFTDPRENGSMKLTSPGYTFLKDKHPHWSQQLPENVSFGNLLFLIKASTYPYYIESIRNEDTKKIDAKKLVTFDPELGVSFKLAGGNFEQLMLILGY
jgi:hypothetical protein